MWSRKLYLKKKHLFIAVGLENSLTENPTLYAAL